MKKQETGSVEIVLIIIVIVLLAGLGYLFYKNKHTKTASVTVTKTTASQATPVAAAGTTAAIDSLTTQDAASESAIDQKHAGNENTAAQSANAAAANVGGAYNESSL